METKHYSIKALFILVVILTSSKSTIVEASGWNQVQKIVLKSGWNAIFLKVTPQRQPLDLLFEGTPITQVNAFYDDAAANQFIIDPSETGWKKEQWRQWLHPSSADSALTDLFVLFSNRAYLVYTTEDYVWEIEGEAALPTIDWRPNNYLLTGFYVDDESTLSFGDYFESSRAHQLFDIYKMVSGRWTKVVSPQTEKIDSNQAYWVYTRGASSYPGPMKVEISTGLNSLDFDAVSNRLELTIRNLGSSSLQFNLEHIARNNNPVVPLLSQSRINNQNSVHSDLTQISNRSLSPSEYRKLSLLVDRRNMANSDERESLLFITGSGMRVPVPVIARRR